jgi:organic hydroperoxide reductase OsmC/OhrA
MTTTHQFEALVSWPVRGEATGTHRVEIPGKPVLEVAAAPQYRGDPSRHNPEELFMAALASCQLLTYLALAGRAGIRTLGYDDRATGTLAVADRKMRMTEVVLRPRIRVAPGTDAAKVRALVAAAHEGCFIANSVSSAVRVEPDVVAG